MSDLICPGDILREDRTGIQVTIVELRPDGFIVDTLVETGKPRNTLNHFHKTWTETFEIISGVGGYSLDNKEYEATPGHKFVVKPGMAHIHPWNTGSEPLTFRQSDIFNPADPTAAVETFLSFSTMFGMARDGKANPDGTSKNPLHALVQFDAFRQHGGYKVGVPSVVQDLMLMPGAALGRALGFKAWYEEYLPRNRNK